MASQKPRIYWLCLFAIGLVKFLVLTMVKGFLLALFGPAKMLVIQIDNLGLKCN